MSDPSLLLPEPVTREKLSVRRAGVLSCVFFGASVTEAVSVNLLPLTLGLFTQDPSIIFWVLAINPAFGFIAQPLAGVASDHVWTPLGRRAVFLFAAAPIVAASLIWIPFVDRFWVLVGAVIVLQFFQDVINGSDQPLLADLVPPQQRTFALGLVKGAENLGFVLVLFLGMPIVTSFADAAGEHRYGLPLYLAAAACQIIFVMVASLFLGEQPIVRQARPRLTPVRYVLDFVQQPMLLRIAAAYFLRAFARAAVVGSAALYAHYTLHLNERQFGYSWGLMPFLALAAGVPLGLFAERFAKHRVLQCAFAMLILASGVGYFDRTLAGFMAAAICFGVGDMLLEVTHKAFMSEHYPPDLIGQLSGAVNCFYAAGRTTALVIAGWCVKLTNPAVDWQSLGSDATVDYSSVWLLSSFASLAGIIILSTTRDLRHEAALQEALTPCSFAGTVSE